MSVLCGDDLVSGSTGSDELFVEDSPLRVAPIVDEVNAKRARRLLLRQIKERGDTPFPKRFRDDDGKLRATLIGAWADDRLVGAALIGPAVQVGRKIVAESEPVAGVYYAAQLVSRHVAIVEGIAVRPEYRRKHVGLQIKCFCDTWAADHEACLVLSIPTNDAARGLNKKAGHIVLPSEVALVIQVVDDRLGQVHTPFALPRARDGRSGCWACKPLGKRAGFAIRVGQYPAVPAMSGTHDESVDIGWFEVNGDGSTIMRVERRFFH